MKPTLRVSTEALCSQPFLTNARSEDLTRRHPVVRIKIAGIKWMLVPSKFLNKHGFYLCKPSPIVGSLLASKNVLRYDTTRGMNVFSGRFSHQETCSLHLPLFPSHPSQAGHCTGLSDSKSLLFRSVPFNIYKKRCVKSQVTGG